MHHAVSITLALGMGLGLAPTPALGQAPPAASSPRADEGVAAFEALRDAYEAERNAFMKAYQSAEDDEARKALAEKFPQPSLYFDRMREIAERHAGSDAAAQACEWVVMVGGGEEDSAWASEMMMRDFFDSPRMATMVRQLGWQVTPAAEADLARLMKDSPHRDVRARATYHRAKQMMSVAKLSEAVVARAADPEAPVSSFAQWYLPKLDAARKETLSDPALAGRYETEGEALLQQVAEEYDDIVLWGEKTLAAQARGDLFEHHNLAIGCVAPDIEGVDASGESFQLSQYRGKVVVLDFWGFW